MVAHDTPASLDARPNRLKLSESADLKEVLRLSSCPRAKPLEGVGKENARAEQTQTRCNRLNHRKYPCAPAPTQRHRTAHSQKDSVPESKIGPD